jgi:hypothetical protein
VFSELVLAQNQLQTLQQQQHEQEQLQKQAPQKVKKKDKYESLDSGVDGLEIHRDEEKDADRVRRSSELSSLGITSQQGDEGADMTGDSNGRGEWWRWMIPCKWFTKKSVNSRGYEEAM